MTTLYFAGQSPCALEFARRWDWVARPLAILVSFAYLQPFEQGIAYYGKAREMILDSGAYTAYTTGKTVDIDKLIAEANKPRWVEAVGLDVIGEWEGSRRNMEYMLPRCPKAMPVFHIGDPWDLFDYYLANWSKVGLSCRFGEDRKTSIRFYDQCFARGWPKKFHSFGWIDDQMLLSMPFHSADAATFVLQPGRFRVYPFRGRGRWRTIQMPIDYKLKLTADGALMNGDRFYGLEQQLKARWAPTLATLEAGS